jgi:hypothetical protein
MNTLQRTQSDSLSVKNQLARTLHRYRHPLMSGLMTAIVGFVIDAEFGDPRIVEIATTPDGFVLARSEGATSLGWPEIVLRLRPLPRPRAWQAVGGQV